MKSAEWGGVKWGWRRLNKSLKYDNHSFDKRTMNHFSGSLTFDPCVILALQWILWFTLQMLRRRHLLPYSSEVSDHRVSTSSHAEMQREKKHYVAKTAVGAQTEEQQQIKGYFWPSLSAISFITRMGQGAISCHRFTTESSRAATQRDSLFKKLLVLTH